MCAWHAVPAGWFTGERKWPTLVLSSLLCACSPGWLVHWGEKMANTGTQLSYTPVLSSSVAQLTVVCMHAALAGWFTGERRWPTQVPRFSPMLSGKQ